jgi:hypothetical protein
MNKGIQVALKANKDKEIDVPLRVNIRKQPCGYL